MPSVGLVHYVTTAVRPSASISSAVTATPQSVAAALQTHKTASAVFGTHGVISLSLDVTPSTLHLVYQFDDFGEVQFDDFSTVELT